MEHEGKGAVKSIGESTVAEATHFSPSQVLVNKHIFKKKKKSETLVISASEP